MGLARPAWRGRPSPHVAIQIWVEHGIDAWMVAAKIEDRRLLRPLSKSGKLIGGELGDLVGRRANLPRRSESSTARGARSCARTCAKLCRKDGGDSRADRIPSRAQLNSNNGAPPRF